MIVPELALGIFAPSDVGGVNETDVAVELLRIVPDAPPNEYVSVFLLPVVLCVMLIVYAVPIVMEDATDIVSFVPETGHACIETVPDNDGYSYEPPVTGRTKATLPVEKLTLNEVLVLLTDHIPLLLNNVAIVFHPVHVPDVYALSPPYELV